MSRKSNEGGRAWISDDRASKPLICARGRSDNSRLFNRSAPTPVYSGCRRETDKPGQHLAGAGPIIQGDLVQLTLPRLLGRCFSTVFTCCPVWTSPLGAFPAGRKLKALTDASPADLITSHHGKDSAAQVSTRSILAGTACTR